VTDDEELVNIEDEQTPLAGGVAEIKATWALVNLLAAIFTAVICVILLVNYFKKKDEEEENTEEQDEEKKKRSKGFRIGSLITAAAAVIIFCLTENMRNVMTLVDRWTLLMIVLFAVEILIAYIVAKKEEDKKNEKENN
jgi:archaellum biogenesis protein FlaJ (TadC family)